MFDYTSMRVSTKTNNNNTNTNNISNEINNYIPIVRQDKNSKFKKIKINSDEFSLITSNTPIVYRYFEKEDDKEKLKITIYYQEVNPLSFNQISNNEMLIEYEILNEKKYFMTLPKERHFFYGHTSLNDCYFTTPDIEKIEKEIIKSLFDISL